MVCRFDFALLPLLTWKDVSLVCGQSLMAFPRTIDKKLSLPFRLSNYIYILTQYADNL